MKVWKFRKQEMGKYYENWKYGKFEKYGIGNMNVKDDNRNKRGSIAGGDKSKNPKGINNITTKSEFYGIFATLV